MTSPERSFINFLRFQYRRWHPYIEGIGISYCGEPLCEGCPVWRSGVRTDNLSPQRTILDVQQPLLCLIAIPHKHLLTTSLSGVILEKLTGFAANQQIPRILLNQKFHYRTHKRPPPVPILNQLHPVPTTPYHFLRNHLNIILPSTSWFPQWSLSLRFPHQHLVHTSPFLHTCHLLHPSYSSQFYHPHNIGWGVQIIKLLII